MNVLQQLQGKLHRALAGLYAGEVPEDRLGEFAAMLKPAQDARFGDYQANCAMALAKFIGTPARAVAGAIAAKLDLGDMLEPPEVAGPGFINLRLRAGWLSRQVEVMARDERLGVEQARPARTYVIDYSSPNVAKPMHVGHLRSTIIGDALARLLRFLGHRVVADNHLGDWGTQFGMLLYGYKHFCDKTALLLDPVGELARLYVRVAQLTRAAGEDEDERDPTQPPPTPEEREAARQVLEEVRQETAKLHAGDRENLGLWKKFMPSCYEEIEQIYQRLDVHFDSTLGESFYNPTLPGIVEELLKVGLARESRGAIVVPPTADWVPEEEAPPAEDGKGPPQPKGPPPAIIRKSDGAFTYTTTDLATLRHRVHEWKPDAILYVVDFRQTQHFKDLFAMARRWGFERVALEHVSFGSVLGPDGKPIKTREGGAVLLDSLLDQAVAAAGEVFEQTRKEEQERGEEPLALGDAEKREIAEVVGIGAVKYADLSQNRTSDYKFNLPKMVAMDGNTATYMQYAYARNRSIFRRGNEEVGPLRTDPPPVLLETPHERALAVQLLRFSEALAAAAEDYRPSHITGYLWDLAKTYSGFFQNCPVLKAETPELRRSRLLLCDLTARVIQRGLDLLGIRTVERM